MTRKAVLKFPKRPIKTERNGKKKNAKKETKKLTGEN